MIYLADAQMLVNLKLRDLFQSVARQNNIPVQTEVTLGGCGDNLGLFLRRGLRGSPHFGPAVVRTGRDGIVALTAPVVGDAGSHTRGIRTFRPTQQ